MERVQDVQGPEEVDKRVPRLSTCTICSQKTMFIYNRGVAGCNPESRHGDRLAYRMPS